MGTLGRFALNPFPFPRKPWDDIKGPDKVRGNDNQIAKNFTAHDADASIHVTTTSTTSVTTSAVAIYPAITNSGFALVNGDNGSGKAFVDQVAWNGTSGTTVPVSSSTVRGAPDARTYTVASGVLKLTMAGGTYSIALVPFVFTT